MQQQPISYFISLPTLTLIFVTLLAFPTWAHSSEVNTQTIPKVFTDPGELPHFETLVRGDPQRLPLKHTHVEVEITGGVARVEVTQSYHNPYVRPIEALYTFPLPMNSAVDRMQMVLGDRTIEAQIKERQAAKEIYERAKLAGKTASLLEQERPNVFAQSVANIAPGSDIDIVVSYVQSMTYAHHQWEFVFPMVVGPRFIPPGHRDARGTEAHARLHPLVLGKGHRPGNDISINVAVYTGSPIHTFHVPTHNVVGKSHDDGSLKLSLASHDRIPNRDFILHYQTASARPQASVLAHREGDDGYFALTLLPPLPDKKTLEQTSREFIFVVDISGSMRGVPLSMCKDAMREALAQVRPNDTFNVLTFAGRTSKAFAQPRRASRHNIKEALSLIDGLKAGGGTMMASAIQEALNPNLTSARERYVFFLTDGYVGNEKEIFARTQNFVQNLQEQGSKARVFGFGVGSSVNRHLLDGLSRAGMGTAFYSSTRQDPALGVRSFFRTIEQPILEDLLITFEGVSVHSLHPLVIPDLLAGRPLEIFGRFNTPGEGLVHIEGVLHGHQERFTFNVTLPRVNLQHESLRSRWARSKLMSLNRKSWYGAGEEIKREMTQLGLQYGLVTRFTSFVAVDSALSGSDLPPLTIEQPSHGAEGVMANFAGNRIQGRSRMFLPQSAPVPMRRLGTANKKMADALVGASVPQSEMSRPATLRGKKPKTAKRGWYLETKGGLNRAHVVKSLQRAWKNKSQCLGPILKTLKVAGKRVEITINPLGRVVHVTIVDSNVQKNDDLCIRQFFQDIRFKKSPGGRSTTVKLQLGTLRRL